MVGKGNESRHMGKCSKTGKTEEIRITGNAIEIETVGT